jgi:hypothetical protein
LKNKFEENKIEVELLGQRSNESLKKYIENEDLPLCNIYSFCHFCYLKEKPKNTVKRILFEKYFETFNFYFAKPINEILANVVISHVIFFKDLLFMLDENEYLKRFYRYEEIKPRM